jgi:hypothetical protein
MTGFTLVMCICHYLNRDAAERERQRERERERERERITLIKTRRFRLAGLCMPRLADWLTNLGHAELAQTRQKDRTPAQVCVERERESVCVYVCGVCVCVCVCVCV